MKRTVGKASKWINVEKIIIGLKIKTREKKKKENAPELQKPNVETRVYKNNPTEIKYNRSTQQTKENKYYVYQNKTN